MAILDIDEDFKEVENQEISKVRADKMTTQEIIKESRVEISERLELPRFVWK
jgi:hypothetical protein